MSIADSYSTLLNSESTENSTGLIYQDDKNRLNEQVTIKQIRLRNLRELIREVGTAAGLARLADTDAAYLSQIVRQRVTPKGTRRGIGDELAEKLERACGKPRGWMDREHDLIPENAPQAAISEKSGEYAVTVTEMELQLLEEFRSLEKADRDAIKRFSGTMASKKEGKKPKK